MNQDELYNHPGWADCTFEGAREQVLRLGLKTTFRQKLEWLEQAGQVAKKFSKPDSRERQRAENGGRRAEDRF